VARQGISPWLHEVRVRSSPSPLHGVQVVAWYADRNSSDEGMPYLRHSSRQIDEPAVGPLNRACVVSCLLGTYHPTLCVLLPVPKLLVPKRPFASSSCLKYLLLTLCTSIILLQPREGDSRPLCHSEPSSTAHETNETGTPWPTTDKTSEVVRYGGTSCLCTATLLPVLLIRL
jgi:hypothetical protein